MLIGYARVSTIDQNLNLQLDALKRAGCEKIYQDKGFSGKKAKRPGLDKALKALKPGDQFMVWKLDRLARSLHDLVRLSRSFEQNNIEFRSLCDAIDTSTVIGKLYFHIIGAVGEAESGFNSQRTKAGMASAKARGVKLGRPRKRTPTQQKQIAKFNSDCLDASAKNIGASQNNAKTGKETLH